ncbi:hypothetical protein IPZ70_24685 [Streptomyces polychromogenes]|nr:hypothetical protein [Streptomyces polychromogenes]
MRLRSTLAAIAGAVALTVAVPSAPASAAVGEFLYRVGPGVGLPHGLTDPPSGECLDVPGATLEEPAHTPRNATLSTATVFLDFGCNGDTFYVLNPGKILGNRLKFRSVVFS